jgi:hypothetical protein
MVEIVAVALLAGLFVGPESCEDAGQPDDCESCDLYSRETVESSDARAH